MPLSAERRKRHEALCPCYLWYADVSRRRLAKLLGLTLDEAELLTSRARRTLGNRAYAIRVAAFLLATTPALRLTMPSTLRRRMIRPLVYVLLPWSSENLLYAQAHNHVIEQAE